MPAVDHSSPVARQMERLKRTAQPIRAASGSTHVNVQQSHRPTHTDNRADVPKSKVPSLVLQVCEDLIAPMAVVRYMECYPPK